jgi:cell division topological specificity factor
VAPGWYSDFEGTDPAWFRLTGKAIARYDWVPERLQLVLVHDRNQIEPGMLELIKDEIIAVISQHIDIDRASVQVNFTEGERESKLVADIPLSSKRQARK